MSSSGRQVGGGWRAKLPSAGTAGKALALTATLAFVTMVGLRAGPAASHPAAPAPSATSVEAPARLSSASATLAAAPAPAGSAEVTTAGGPPATVPGAGVLSDGRV